MSRCARFCPLVLLLVGLSLSLPVHAQLYNPAAPGTTNATIAPIKPTLAPSAPAAPVDQVTLLLRQAMTYFTQGQLDQALGPVNDALKVDPKNLGAFSLRGGIYTEQKKWDLGAADYQTILQIDPKNVLAKFNLAEIKFRQKLYDQARPGFLELESAPENSDFPYAADLATYKVFLCDLFGGHEDVASKEHDALDQIGTNASFYFANAAWSLYHHQIEDGRGWLLSALHIYPQNKVNLYAASLKDLGYLPLPPPPQTP